MNHNAEAICKRLIHSCFLSVACNKSSQTETFHMIPEKKMRAAESLAVAITQYRIDQHEDWPFVTLSAFQERANTMKDSSGVLFVGMNPIISHENRLAWENYTMHHPDSRWYQDAQEYQKESGISDLDNRPQIKTDDPNLDLSTGIASHIYDFEKEMVSLRWLHMFQELFHIVLVEL